MNAFREISATDRDWMGACRNPERSPFTALSFPSLFSWRNTYGLTVAGDRDYFVIRSEHDRAYYMPCGDPEKCRSFILETARKEQPGVRFLYLTREQAASLRQEGFSILIRDDLSEYLCPTGSMALREGFHASNSYKMKIRHFRRAVPYTVRMLSEQDVPLLRELSETMPPAGNAEDGDVLAQLLDGFACLGIRGLMMETADSRKAFILGYENRPGELSMVMTRHVPELPAEVTAVLAYEFAGSLPAGCGMINLEEDLGIAGLRRAKQLYSPSDRLNVYEAIR